MLRPTSIRLLAALLAVALFTTVGLALAAGQQTTTSASNRAAGLTAAKRILAETPLPAGAVPSATDPAGAVLLKGPGGGIPVTDEGIDVHHYWTVPGDPDTVLQWIERHKPPGSQMDGTGSTNGPNGSSASVSFSLPGVPGVISQEDLTVAVEAISGGQTAMRADGEVVWIVTRPASEVIPSGTQKIQLYVDPASGHGSYLTDTITRPSEIARLVKLINSFPITQPGVVFGCPAISPQTPAIDLRFFGASGSTPIAQVKEDDCEGLQFTLDGHQTTGLQESQDLRTVMWQLHAIPVCQGLTAKASPPSTQPGATVALSVAFQNPSAGAVCGLEGSAHVTLIGADGQPLPTHVKVAHYAPNVVVLLPKVAATLNLFWPTPTSGCAHPTASTVHVTLPGSSQPTTVKLATASPVDPCNGAMTANPLAGP